MAMEIDPYRGGAIEIFLALRIDEVRAFSTLDNQRLLLLPLLHLGKRMPEVAAVPVSELLRRR